MADDEGAGTEVTSIDSRIIELPITAVLSKETDDGYTRLKTILHFYMAMKIGQIKKQRRYHNVQFFTT